MGKSVHIQLHGLHLGQSINIIQFTLDVLFSVKAIQMSTEGARLTVFGEREWTWHQQTRVSAREPQREPMNSPFVRPLMRRWGERANLVRRSQSRRERATLGFK